VAYVTSTVGWLSLSKTHERYAAFKNSASKKKRAGFQKTLRQRQPTGNPAQNFDHPDYQESLWGFYHQDGTFGNGSGDRDCTCLAMLMRHLNSLEFYPAVVKRTYPELTIDLLICQQSKFIFLCRFFRVDPQVPA
jgi:hypothetical protein